MILTLLLAIGCSQHALDATWTSSPHVPMAGSLTWSSATPGKAAVRVSSGVGHDWQTAFSDVASTEHHVPVLGMRGGGRYTLTPLLELDDGELLEGDPVEVTQALPPAWVPNATVVGDWPEGFFATHLVTLDDSAVVIYDSEGFPVWVWAPAREHAVRIISAGLNLDGSGVTASDVTNDLSALEGHLSEVSLDGERLADFPGAQLHHHPVATPEGTWGVFEKVQHPLEEGVVLYDRLLEIDPESGEAEVLFDPVELFEIEPVCREHWELTLPVSDGEPPELRYDWTHANSLVLAPDGEAWLMMIRHWDALLRIHRDGSGVDWILGGPFDELGLEANSPEAFSHAHFSEAVDDRLLIFDNHLHREEQHSRVVEYRIDPDTPEVELISEYWDMEHGTLEWLGDPITLPDGTRMVSWTDQGRLSWHEPDWTLKGELMMPVGAASGRISWLPDLDP